MQLNFHDMYKSAILMLLDVHSIIGIFMIAMMVQPNSF